MSNSETGVGRASRPVSLGVLRCTYASLVGYSRVYSLPGGYSRVYSLHGVSERYICLPGVSERYICLPGGYVRVCSLPGGYVRVCSLPTLGERDTVAQSGPPSSHQRGKNDAQSGAPPPYPRLYSRERPLRYPIVSFFSPRRAEQLCAERYTLLHRKRGPGCNSHIFS